MRRSDLVPLGAPVRAPVCTAPGDGAAIEYPHSLQNLAPGASAVPHCGQVTAATSRSRRDSTACR